MRITLKVGDTLAEIDGGAADCAVNVVAFLYEKFGKVGAILASDAGDQSCFHIFIQFSSLSVISLPIVVVSYNFSEVSILESGFWMEVISWLTQGVEGTE